MIEFVGPTPNRWPGALNDFRYRVDHTTEGGFAGSLAWLLNPASEVSAQLLVPEDGRILQLCDLRDAAWHAGRVFEPSTPYYEGTNPNLVAVGVEFVGTYLRPLSPAQIEASVTIDEVIRRTFGVQSVPHVPHSALATGGSHMRRDPGEENFLRLMAAIGGDDMFGENDRATVASIATGVRDLYDKVNALAINIPFVWLDRLADGLDPATGAPLPLRAEHVAALKKAAKEASTFVKAEAKKAAAQSQKGEWPGGMGPEPVAPERAVAKKMVRKTRPAKAK